MHSFIIDTDTASDDAVALLMALHDPLTTIRAVTVVAGNVPLQLAIRNALSTLALGRGHDVAVYAGCAAPLVRQLETAQDVHGLDGMGGVSLPQRLRGTEIEHAVDALRRISLDEPGQHSLVTLGPLTNIAAALTLDPWLLTRFKQVFMMAGAPDAVGNVNPVAEYNVWADPEAAAIVLRAPGDKTMIGWNVSRSFAVIEPDDADRLRAAGPMGELICDINASVDRFCREVTNLPGYDLPDPVTMAVALDHDIVVRREALTLDVVLDGPARGMTFANRLLTAGPANTKVVWEVDRERFFRRLLHLAAWPLG